MPESIEIADNQALGLPFGPVTDVGEIRRGIAAAMHAGCNVLTPLGDPSYLAPSHAVIFRAFTFDASQPADGGKSNGTFYRTENGTAALHANLLARVALDVGISVVASESGFQPPFDVAYLWRYQATVRFLGYDGMPRFVVGDKELDLRDDAVAGWLARDGRLQTNRIVKAREAGSEMTATKATNRAYRKALGMRGGYSSSEAARPFVIAQVVYQLPQTPEIARMQAAAALGLTGAIYGPGTPEPAAAAPPAPAPDPDRERRQEAGRAATEQRKQQRQPPAVHRDPPPPDDDWGGHPPIEEPKRTPPQQQQPEQQRGEAYEVPTCSVCKVEIHETVHDYSVRKFERPLCLDHQRAERDRQ